MKEQKLALNGVWEIALDADNRGLAEDWPTHGFPSSIPFHTIHVPGIWQEQFSDYIGVVWYRRCFVAPSAWKSQRIALCFGAVDFAARVWLNGRLLGEHVGGFTPFTLDASHAIRLGQENELVVRVADCGVDKEVDGYILSQIPCAKSIWYHNFSGIYQHVYLEATSHVHINDIFAWWDGTCLHMRLEIENTAHVSLTSFWYVALYDGAMLVGEQNGTLLNCTPGRHLVESEIAVGDPHLWSPADPYLYRLVIRLSGGMGGTDIREVRVGLRTIALQEKRFLLNGQPWVPKMILYQPHYPSTLAYPPSDDFVRQEMTQIKQAGFDMVRFHLKPPPPLYLDLADEMGITVYAETALGWIRTGPRLRQHFRQEITETIRRDRNHPSIVLWGIINENAREAATAYAMLRYARRLDGSRPIVDNCGAFSVWDGGGWLSSSHILAPSARVPQDWPDLHIYIRTPLTQDEYDWLNQIGQEGGTEDPSRLGYGDVEANQRWLASFSQRASPVFVSEYGVGALPDLDAVVAAYSVHHGDQRDKADQESLRDSLWALMTEYGLTNVYPTIAALAEAEGQNMAEGIRWQTEALRSNPQIVGYGLLQYNDASWEIGAGLVDQWRRPKLAFGAAQAANVPLLLALAGHLRNARVGDIARVRCTLVNEVRKQGTAFFIWVIRDPGGRVVREVLIRAELDSSGIQPLASLTFPIRAEGAYTLEAWLECDHATLCRSVATLYAWDEPPCLSLTAPALFVHDADAAPVPASGEEQGGLWIITRPRDVDTGHLSRILQWVKEGHTAVFLEMWEQDIEYMNQIGLLPFSLSLRCAPSSWLGYVHFAHAHPIFVGLPAPGLLGRQEYNATCPRRSLIGMPGECIVVGMSSTGLERARYQWVQPSFWAGSDLQIVPWGRGRLIFSQLLLRETVGRDPVADRLFRNLVRFGLAHK